MKNSKIGVGIVGLHPDRGWAMLAHVPALKASGDYEIVALSNSNEAAAQLAAKKFGIPNAFTKLDDLLACPEVDLVVVTVRVPQHLEIVRAAIEAGKAIYVEWPLANGMDEALELERLARLHGSTVAVGLQSRASPEVSYVRDLVKQGYVGEVMSATLVGSGILGGDMIPASFAYTLDPSNGAAMLNVAFAHAIDSACYALDSELEDVMALLKNRRRSALVIETGATVEMKTADQIAVAGSLRTGPILTAHFRGGMSRATNFRLEINGTRGDLVLTSTLGYPGVGSTTILGGNGEDTTVAALELPAAYAAKTELGMGANVYRNYALLASDLRTGSRTAPGLDQAVGLHRLLTAIELSASVGNRQAVRVP